MSNQPQLEVVASTGQFVLLPPNAVREFRDPTSQDVGYISGTPWVNRNTGALFFFSENSWVSISGGTGSFTNVTASGTVTAGTGITSTTGNISATAGAVNAGTSITATNGNITATNGNVVINGAGKQLQVQGGSLNDFMGSLTLTAGAATLTNSGISASDQVFFNCSNINASTAIGVRVRYITTPGVGALVESLDATGAIETADVSTLNYIIIRQL